MNSRGNAMLTITPADPLLPEGERRTELFGLPLASGKECGGCVRFVALEPRCQVTGRCKLGIKPGLINRRTTACNIHRPRGVPRKFQGRVVRP